MRKAALVGSTAVAIMMSSAAANAALIFTTTLSGAAQVPPSASTATGSATVTLESDNTTLDVNVAFSGLTGGSATAAHIHCCAAADATSGVAVPFTGFPAATSGTYSNTFDLTTDLNTTGGLTVATFLAGLELGLAYVNIHDADFPGGEIRGQLSLVPEPPAIGILGLSAVGVFAIRRRRQVC